MRIWTRSSVVGSVVFVAVVLGLVADARAQVNPRDVPVVIQPQQRFDSGQDIQPIYEGWTRNEDGSFTLHFGYLNRNYREQPHVPIGPSNHFTPGEPDRGQPTYFYPRTQRYQFTVQVPATMGRRLEDGLVWTVTHNGSEQRAIGWLKAEWEIDENTIASNLRLGFGRAKRELYENQSPTVAVSAAQPTVAVGEPLTLTATLEDDELPTKLPPRKPRENTIPSLKAPEDAPKAPDNIRWYRKPSPPRNGLSLLWVVYRGPDDATFEPAGFQRAYAEERPEESQQSVVVLSAAGAPANEAATSLEGDGFTAAKFETTVRFDTPGTYTLRAFACDAMAYTPADVTVTVTGPDTQP